MDIDHPARGHSARVRVVAVVAAALALFLLVDGVLTGVWVQVLWIVLCVSSGLDWWTGGRRSDMDRRWPRVMWAGRVVWCLGLGAAGVVSAVTADSVLVLSEDGCLSWQRCVAASRSSTSTVPAQPITTPKRLKYGSRCASVRCVE